MDDERGLRRDEDGIERVLRFWLDEVGPKAWYAVDPKVDRRCAEEFGDLLSAAAAGGLSGWMATPRGALALLILLDQLPRNAFRGIAGAFVGDRRARTAANLAISLGHDLAIPEPERQFFYLPLMHSEFLADQDRCVRLVMMRLPAAGAENMHHGVRHREVIRRFGRFPSRNAALGRADTDEERAYRAERGYMG